MCKHSICETCTRQLRDTRCPTCRNNLQGGFYTPETESIIKSAIREDAHTAQLMDMLYADYINEHGDRRGVREDARSLTDAFGTFISANPDISPENAVRIFRAFVEFYKINLDRYTPDVALNNFNIIGLTMLDNPTENFNKIYDLLFK